MFYPFTILYKICFYLMKIIQKDSDVLYQYNSKINWNVSGFGNDITLYIILSYIKYLKKFGINNPIRTIHGSYMSKYNGGRLALYSRPINYIYDKIKEINSLGIGVKMTFSTPIMTKEMYEEDEMRGYLEVLNENKELGNGIICSVDEFADFIHKNYPNLEVTSSYVKMATETKLGVTDTVDYYNNLFNIYDNIVINNYRLYDDDFLNKINHIDKIEVIVNNSCNLNCPIAHKHYEAMYELNQRVKYLYDNKIFKTDPQVAIIRKKLKSINDNCKARRSEVNIQRKQYEQLSREEINNLTNKGIINFKIEGRDYDFHFFRFILFNYIFINDSMLSICPVIPSDKEIEDFYQHKILDN